METDKLVNRRDLDYPDGTQQYDANSFGWYFDTYCKEINPDTPIYRILPIEYVISMFKNSQLVIASMAKWDDPYENYMAKSTVFNLKTETIDLLSMTKHVFAQSWSLQEESDAMWRIYSQKREAFGMTVYGSVRIKTTIDKLYHALVNNDVSRQRAIHFGKVKYVPQENLHDEYINIIQASSTFKMVKCLFPSFFIKRIEFEHEHEFRIFDFLCDDQLAKMNGQQCIAYDVNPTELIDEVTLDPRLEDAAADFTKSFLVGHSINEKIINQSMLYRLSASRLVVTEK